MTKYLEYIEDIVETIQDKQLERFARVANPFIPQPVQSRPSLAEQVLA